MATSDGRKVRWAVVGAGWITQAAVLPAFANAANARLRAILSSDEAKRRALGERYRVDARPYEDYDACLRSGAIDAVYIALPNAQHRDYAVRAAKAGVHVLCEKPMAVTSDECADMVRAADEAHVKLMIAYRLHFERATLEAIEVVRSGALGDVRAFASTNLQDVEAGNSRLDPKLGAAPLLDMGVYCINAARNLFGAEPTEVLALDGRKPGDARWSDEVPETTSALLRFPDDRVATFTCGYGAAVVNEYRVIGTKGDLRVEPAFVGDQELVHWLRTGGGAPKERRFAKSDQFGAELVYFSDCVLHDREPEPSGEEGLADVRVCEAIVQSARTGRAVAIAEIVRRARPTIAQAIELPPVRAPRMVHAATPQGPSR